MIESKNPTSFSQDSRGVGTCGGGKAPSVFEADDAVGEFGDAGVVRDDDERFLLVGDDAAEEFHHFHA